MQTVFFGGHQFQNIWRDPEGDIFLSSLRRHDPNGITVRCGLKKGCSYTPGMHPYDVTVTVLKGTGLFLLLDKALAYKAGSEFSVPALTAHSFVKIESDTVFTKEALSFEPR